MPSSEDKKRQAPHRRKRFDEATQEKREALLNTPAPIPEEKSDKRAYTKQIENVVMKKSVPKPYRGVAEMLRLMQGTPAVRNELGEIIKDKVPPRLAPEDLTTDERRAMVDYLIFEGFDKETLSDMFHVSVQTIYVDLRENLKAKAKIVSHTYFDEVVADFLDTHDRLKAKALKSNDNVLAWKITCDKVSYLQSLGLVYRKPIELDIEETLIDELQHAGTEEARAILEAVGQIKSTLGSDHHKLLPEGGADDTAGHKDDSE